MQCLIEFSLELTLSMEETLRFLPCWTNQQDDLCLKRTLKASFLATRLLLEDSFAYNKVLDKMLSGCLVMNALGSRLYSEWINLQVLILSEWKEFVRYGNESFLLRVDSFT